MLSLCDSKYLYIRVSQVLIKCVQKQKICSNISSKTGWDETQRSTLLQNNFCQFSGRVFEKHNFIQNLSGWNWLQYVHSSVWFKREKKGIINIRHE